MATVPGALVINDEERVILAHDDVDKALSDVEINNKLILPNSRSSTASQKL